MSGDGEVQCGAEAKESSNSREEETASRRPFNRQAQDQGPTPFPIRKTQTQALQKMAPGILSLSLSSNHDPSSP